MVLKEDDCHTVAVVEAVGFLLSTFAPSFYLYPDYRHIPLAEYALSLSVYSCG